MPDANPPNPDPDAHQRARQKSSMLLACSLLVLMAIALLVLPLEGRMPKPARFFLAAFDFAIAAVLWLVTRQKFSGK
jgi:hypothetical protein